MSLKYSAIPFLILLVLLVATVVWSDDFAENLSEQARVVHIGGTRAELSEAELWQFEQELSAQGDQPEPIQDSVYMMAVRAYEQEAWSSSEMYFEAYANNNGYSPQLLNYLGLIDMKTGDFNEAVRHLQEAIRADSSFHSARINLALLYSKLENFQKADSIYRDLAKRAPFNARPKINHGIMLCRVGEWSAARDVLTSAVTTSSGRQKAKALTYRGMTQVNLSDTTAGRADFEAAILLAPDYILPRVYQALLAPTDEEKLDEITKVTRLRESYAPAHYYRGVILDRMGLKDDARRSFERALELNPGDSELSSLLGAFYINNDLISEAEQYFTLVYGQDSLAPQNYFFKAKIASRKDELQEAIGLYRKAISASGDNYAEAYHNLGILLKRDNRFAEAIDAYQEAIRLRPNYESAWYNLALTYRAQEKSQAAISAYEKALNINPQAVKSMYNLAAIYSEEKQEGKAADLWKRIIAIDPDYAKAWYNLGLYHQKNAQYGEAVAVYSNMLERFPSYSKAWYNKAIALKELNRIDEAVTAYEEALRFDVTYLPAWKNLGAIEAQRGNTARAIEVFTQAVELSPADAEMRFNLALQLKETKNFTEAAVQLNRAIQLRKEYVKAIDLLAEIAAETNDKRLETKTRDYRATIDNDPEIWYEFARDLHKAGQYDAAIERYTKAELAGKNDEWVAYWRGKAHEEAGREKEAISNYKEALKRKPDHKFSLYRLTLLLSDKSVAEARNYRNKLVQLYPDFAREKGIIQ